VEVWARIREGGRGASRLFTCPFGEEKCMDYVKKWCQRGELHINFETQGIFSFEAGQETLNGKNVLVFRTFFRRDLHVETEPRETRPRSFLVTTRCSIWSLWALLCKGRFYAQPKLRFKRMGASGTFLASCTQRGGMMFLCVDEQLLSPLV
jgi:hypothetical protein